MQLAWTESAWSDYLYWQETDKKTLKKINSLIKEILRSPFTGTGSPEPLKHQLSGCWSRRISQEHRLVYQVGEQTLLIIQCRYHY